MPPIPVRFIEDALIALILARRLDGLIPSIRAHDLNEKTLNTALKGAHEAGYLTQRSNGRYDAVTPSRMQDPDINRLAAELAAAAKKSGATLNDLGPLLVAHMLVPDLADEGVPLKPLAEELRDAYNRPRRARNHPDGDEPGTLRRRNRVADEALRDDHG
ncbi:hypothetical protein [Leifsonia aquatica]|uniref:hypothetical protein n=1 Tax=Leifsonia aquatica TaxID=144185 RepID=UPI00380DE268